MHYTRMTEDAQTELAVDIRTKAVRAMSADAVPEMLRKVERDHGPMLQPHEVVVHRAPVFLNARNLNYDGSDSIAIEARGVFALVRLDQSTPRQYLGKPKYSVASIDILDTDLHCAMLGCSYIGAADSDRERRDLADAATAATVPGAWGASRPGRVSLRVEPGDGSKYATRRSHNTIVNYAVECGVLAIEVYLLQCDIRSREEVTTETIELTGDMLMTRCLGALPAYVGAAYDLCQQKVGVEKITHSEGKTVVEYSSADPLDALPDGVWHPRAEVLGFPEVFSKVELMVAVLNGSPTEVHELDIEVTVYDTSDATGYSIGDAVYRFSARQDLKGGVRVLQDRATLEGGQGSNGELRSALLKALVENGF